MRAERIRDALLSPILPVLLVLTGVLIARPWGNFPVNDDWQYAHIAETFAKTWEIRIDRPIAPALIVQTVWGGLLIRVFGFSHVVLRIATLVVSLLGLLMVDLLLRQAKVGPARRAAALLVLGFNPLGFVLGASFMTEPYGTLPALLAIWIWNGRGEALSPSLLRALFATLAAGTAYLTRQFSGLVLPALILAALIELLRSPPRRSELVRALIPLVSSGLLFSAIVVTHVVWNKASGNETDQLANPLKGVLLDKGAAMAVMGGASIFYLAPFLAPLFAAMSGRLTRRLAASVIVATLGVATFQFSINKFHDRRKDLHYTLNRSFPYLTNIIGEGGIGPFTTTDVYVEKSAIKPKLPLGVWKITQYAVYGLAVFLPLAIGWTLSNLATNPAAQRLALTGALFFLVSMGASLQVYGFDFFDRYLWTPLIGLTLFFAAGLPVANRSKWLRVAVFTLFLAPLAIFSVAGTHDYFQWHKVRWHLYKQVLEQGISPLSIDSGYETNGWFAYDAWKRGEDSPSCVSICHRNWLTWYCADDSYRISHLTRRGDITLERIQPRSWLSRMPALVLMRKPDP